MIAVVCVNPVVDKTCYTDELLTGDINKVNRVYKSAGGKGVNVTRILSRLKEKVCIIGFKAGYSGKWVEDELKKEGALAFFVEVNGETSVNTNIINSSNEIETQILEPGPDIYEDSIAIFDDIYTEVIKKSSWLICSGNLTRGLENNFYRTLISKAKEYEIKTIVDTSEEALRNSVDVSPFMIKSNLDELSYHFKREIIEIPDVITASKEFLKSGVKVVLTSIGKDGAILVYENEIYHCKVPKIKTINSIGGGGALLAGFTSALNNDKPIEYALRFGAACAVLINNDNICGDIVYDDLLGYMEEIKIKIL